MSFKSSVLKMEIISFVSSARPKIRSRRQLTLIVSTAGAVYGVCQSYEYTYAAAALIVYSLWNMYKNISRSGACLLPY